MPGQSSRPLAIRQEHECFDPLVCGAPTGDCEWCCMTPPGDFCHQDGTETCGLNGGGEYYHCEEHVARKAKN